MSDIKDILRAAACANGWEVFIDNDSDIYRQPDDPEEVIKVTWAGAPGVMPLERPALARRTESQHSDQGSAAPTMRWYARPEGDSLKLRVAPRLASWEKAGHPDQVRLEAYLDDTRLLLAESRITDGPWALRLDVGMPPGRDLLDMADLDNYAYPLAYHLRDSDLVSVWCTKQHNDESFVRIEAAREMHPQSTEVLVARTSKSATTLAFKKQVHAAVAGASVLPAGPVRLELAFVVGPRRNWLNLWKQTIDSLDPLLGRTDLNRDWHPLDGRITELGMHRTVDPALGYDVVIGIAAAPG
jgi:hypothetical protein